YAVYGASGCGRGIMPLAQLQLQRQGIDVTQLVFIDDKPAGPEVNGRPVLGYAEFLSRKTSARYAVLAIANGATREKLAERCAADGVRPWTVSAANVVTMYDVVIGEGAMLSPFVTLTSNIRIGRHFHANLYSYVEHDCVIGDFVTFAPGAHCNGNIHIQDHAYIGAGAIIKQGTPDHPLIIGRGAIVGMGAVVTHNVLPATVVAGNPARPLIKG
ncbi:MAG: acetyltransferase, partial [Burkholderiaceae bacterium]